MQEAVKEFNDSWHDAGLDAFIFPTLPYPSLPLKLAEDEDLSIRKHGYIVKMSRYVRPEKKKLRLASVCASGWTLHIKLFSPQFLWEIW